MKTTLLLGVLLLVSSSFSKENPFQTGEGPKVELGSSKYECTGGVNPSRLSHREYMEAFTKGPCAPVIMAPGIGGSVLQVIVDDCEAFRASNPTGFQNCGWKSCDPNDKHSPNKEYRIWIPYLTSPMEIFRPGESNKVCWSAFVRMEYNMENGDLVPVKTPGLTLKAAYETPETYQLKTGKCGVNSIQNLFPHMINPEPTAYYSMMISKLEGMGYSAGLSLIGLPYDFRSGESEDDYTRSLIYALNQLNTMTGKKTIITAHSMGNMRTINALWTMSQEDKDKLIHSYLALAPSYLGSPMIFKNLVCGAKDFDFLFGLLGIDFKRFKESIGSFLSTFELAPSLIYSNAADEPWMKAIKQRIKYENGELDSPGEIDWIPKRDQVCYKDFNQHKCRSGLYDFQKWGKYKDEVLDNSNYRQWISDYSFFKNTQTLWKRFKKAFDSTLAHPGVKINLVYSGVLPTQMGYDYLRDPREYTNKDDFCPDKDGVAYRYLYNVGDSTVPSTSATTPGYKWALEFKNKVGPAAKPIQFIELCSSYNSKTSPWDAKDSSGVKTFSTNGYIGLPCDCTQNKMRHCDHGSMLFLPQLVNFFGETVQTGQSGPVPEAFSKMTDEQIEEYVGECQALVKDKPSYEAGKSTSNESKKTARPIFE